MKRQKNNAEPKNLTGSSVTLAGMAGFEPAGDGVKVRCLNRLATSHNKNIRRTTNSNLFIIRLFMWGG